MPLTPLLRAAKDFARQCEENITEWRWATDLMVSAEPLHDLVKRQSLYWTLQNAKWVAREDEAGYDARLHGFDSTGRLGAWRHRNGPMSYLVYGQDHVDELVTRQNLGITRYCFEDRATTLKYEASTDGCAEERFERIGAHYLGSTIRHARFDHKSFEESNYVDRLAFIYDEQGKLDRVSSRTTIDGVVWPPELLFIRPRGENLSATLQGLEELLIDQIPDSIRLRPPREPVYCIAIVYCGEDFYWPRSMCVGTESLRQRLFTEEDPQWRHKALIPGEWGEPKLELPLWLPTAHDRAVELQLRAVQLMYAPAISVEGAAQQARELLQRVAAKLAKINWTPIMPVTDDFIAYVIDDTGEFDSREDIRASVSAAQIATLREQGYRWL